MLRVWTARSLSEDVPAKTQQCEDEFRFSSHTDSRDNCLFASLHIDSGKKNLNRSYKRWNEREEEQMRRYVQLKWTDKQIAEKLERSERAIKQRKQLLGMG